MKPILQNGSLCLSSDDGTIFARDLSCGVRYTGNLMNTLYRMSHGDWTLSGNTASCDNATLTFTQTENGILVQTAFRYDGEALPSTDAFLALRCTLTAVPNRILQTVPHNTAGNRIGDMQSKVETAVVQWGGFYESADFALAETDTHCALLGFSSFEEYFSLVRLQGDGICEFRQITEKHPLAFGQTLVSDTMLLSVHASPFEALAQYGQRLAVPMRFPVPTGHCSWYYYKSTVRDTDVAEHSSWLAEHKERFPVKYIQIDDGWYDLWGDWNPNEKFDLPALCAQIRRDGFIPGLWFCPFGAYENSRILQTHPEYFVHRADGSLWHTDNRYCLDFSHPGACAHLQDTVRRFVREYGIGYIKMDILSNTLAPGVHSDPTFNALKNYRKCLRLVKEAAGKDVFLLGCTAPLLPSVGLVDGMRTSGDVFDSWENLPWIFGRILKRYWTNGLLYWNDADCLLVRTADEEDEQCQRPCTRTPQELVTFAVAMASTGGALMFSDKLPLLKEWQLSLLDACLPVAEQAAVPLDLMDSAVPGILETRHADGTGTITLINWGDTPRTFSAKDGTFCETLAPHTARQLRFSADTK